MRDRLLGPGLPGLGLRTHPLLLELRSDLCFRAPSSPHRPGQVRKRDSRTHDPDTDVVRNLPKIRRGLSTAHNGPRTGALQEGSRLHGEGIKTMMIAPDARPLRELPYPERFEEREPAKPSVGGRGRPVGGLGPTLHVVPTEDRSRTPRQCPLGTLERWVLSSRKARSGPRRRREHEVGNRHCSHRDWVPARLRRRLRRGSLGSGLGLRRATESGHRAREP